MATLPSDATIGSAMANSLDNRRTTVIRYAITITALALGYAAVVLGWYLTSP